MATYNTISDPSPLVLEAWDGTYEPNGHGCDPYDPPLDHSKPRREWPAPYGLEVPYEPVVISESSKYADKQGIPWKQCLDARLLKMTPWMRSRTETRNFIGKVPHFGEIHGRLCGKETQIGVNESPVYTCQLICLNKTIQSGVVSWKDAGDFKRWSADLGWPVIAFSGIDWSEVVSAIQDVSLDAVNKSYKDYDALTDVMQLNQTAEFFNQTASNTANRFRRFFSGFPASDVRYGSRISPKRLLRDSSRAIRKLGAAWLAYRYAVMPLLWSYNDIRKVVKRSWMTKDYSSKTVSPVNYNPSSLPNNYIRVDVTGSIRVRASVACMYSSGRVAQMSRISINPLSTAWELIPYSFVVDWFINVGDFITNNFTPDFSNGNNQACVSLRSTLLTTKTLHWYVYEDRYNWYEGSLANACWPYPQPSFFWHDNHSSGDEVLQTIQEDSYDRKLFSRGGAQPIGTGFGLNWKRITDSIALSHGLVKKLRGFF